MTPTMPPKRARQSASSTAEFGKFFGRLEVVDLAELITNSSERGDIVVDMFLGSGTTLVACLKTGRVFRGMELDPGYVDVACVRAAAMVDQAPILERTGKPFPGL